jgi:hypothetical protein
MRYKHASMFGLLLLLPLFSGCHSGIRPLPVGTFVNQSDPSQELELTLDPSKTPNPFIRISIETGASKYVGKSVGTYMLKTQQGISKGTFAFTVITIENTPLDDSWHQVGFTAENGSTWKLTVQKDGSLLDSSGVAWKRETRG